MKQERIIHIELGVEAADVIGWMRSLPNRTINQTVDEILACYSSGDETEGDGKLRRLDCDGILQTAFDEVFGTIPKSAAGATFSADENQTPTQPDPNPQESKPIFVSDEDDWWDEYYYEEDDV